MQCQRCGNQTGIHSTSWFNTEDICIECQQDEQQCPNFALAKQIENDAVRRGDYNFRGIGLAAEDRVVIARLLAQRNEKR